MPKVDCEVAITKGLVANRSRKGRELCDECHGSVMN